MNQVTANFISEEGTSASKELHAYFTAISAALLPFILTCAGTQQKILNPSLHSWLLSSKTEVNDDQHDFD